MCITFHFHQWRPWSYQDLLTDSCCNDIFKFQESKIRCDSVKCPYGVIRYRDDRSSCVECHCNEPCDGFQCTFEGTKCAVELIWNQGRNQSTGDSSDYRYEITFYSAGLVLKYSILPDSCPELLRTLSFSQTVTEPGNAHAFIQQPFCHVFTILFLSHFRAVCREERKVGVCPKVIRNNPYSTCSEDCSSDADCDNSQKCCFNGCGRSCMSSVQDPGTQLSSLDADENFVANPNAPNIKVTLINFIN